ncbi:hypothetical protein [Virgibacillus sp. DJP39]
MRGNNSTGTPIQYKKEKYNEPILKIKTLGLLRQIGAKYNE